MLGFLKKIFGEGVNLGEVISGGAVIIDVRTKEEFRSGHLKNSVNIPLSSLPSSLKKLKKDQPIVTCCASGSRSVSARSFLRANGYEKVYNGGSWTSLRKYNK